MSALPSASRSNSNLAWCFASRHRSLLFFFFNDTATTEIYTLSLHDALPIFDDRCRREPGRRAPRWGGHSRGAPRDCGHPSEGRSEEHTSELQSRPHLVCRLLLEKKKQHPTTNHHRQPTRIHIRSPHCVHTPA